MRASFLTVIGIALPLQVAAAGGATFQSGNDILLWCRTANWQLCYGYIEGVADAMSNGEPVLGWRACIPAGVTVGQVKDATLQFLQIHIGFRQKIAASLVAAALSETFPCR